MSKFMKILLYVIAILLLMAGTAVVLELVNISFSSVALLLISIAMFALYKKFNLKLLKIFSFILFPTGISYFLISTFQVVDELNFILIYSAIVCALWLIYIDTKQSVWLYISLAVALFAMHVFTRSISGMSDLVFGYDCFYFALLALILFVFEHNKLGYKPLFVSMLSYLYGVIELLIEYKIISLLMYKLLLAAILIIAGVVIVLFISLKSHKDKKENLYE